VGKKEAKEEARTRRTGRTTSTTRGVNSQGQEQIVLRTKRR
jgi:hypothetical protein